MLNSEIKKQDAYFSAVKIETSKVKLWIFIRIALAIYFCGFVNYKITNYIIELLFKNSLFDQIAQYFLHACFSFLAILILFPRKLRGELYVKERREFRFGVLLAIGFPLCLIIPTAGLHLYFGANLSLVLPSIVNIISITLLSIAAALEEELVCRFLLFDRLSRVLGVAISVVIQLIFFVVLHYSQPHMSLSRQIMLSVTSLLLVALYRRTRSLLVVMAMHFSYDFFLTIFFGGFLGYTHFVGFVSNTLLGEKYSNYLKLVTATLFIGYLIITTKSAGNKDGNNVHNITQV
ncbi:CPBP family intramembrane metalloprotease [Undibacterium sp. 14-3-2]|uniref:CPBP family intramembrane glutamic endopeptidase n=1 Tax=Undibacterium sp. 14-3-2 TaxID=2800129 RepID=UPI001905C88E|nr:type II CAAX endopeptidase family protein [Undibacterium sp. 14-3-2]MBK1889310.1 CPBP family intramembrane metalloprotease [Undibacterium sp. 14-3-2]